MCTLHFESLLRVLKIPNKLLSGAHCVLSPQHHLQGRGVLFEFTANASSLDSVLKSRENDNRICFHCHGNVCCLSAWLYSLQKTSLWALSFKTAVLKRQIWLQMKCIQCLVWSGAPHSGHHMQIVGYLYPQAIWQPSSIAYHFNQAPYGPLLSFQTNSIIKKLLLSVSEPKDEQWRYKDRVDSITRGGEGKEPPVLEGAA